MELSRTIRGVEIDWETVENLEIAKICFTCMHPLNILATQAGRIVWAQCETCNKEFNIPVR